MQQITNDTALLLFSRTSRQEALYKNFFSKAKKGYNERVAQKLIGSSIKTARQTRLPFFIIDERMQTGNSFGERLSNAIDSIFQKGFQKVIIIGNDCLSITSGIIHKAAAALEKNDVLLAPTSKGGVYLIGLTKKSFDENRFVKINWQTSSVFDDLVQYAVERNYSSMLLPCLNDINSPVDLKKSVYIFPAYNSFRLTIISLFASLQNFLLCYFYQVYAKPVFCAKPLRAPPFNKL